eukprot:1156645-Pelagomonas_calceolata.AAC.5
MQAAHEPEVVELDLTREGSSHGSKRRATQQPLTNTSMLLSKQQHDFHKKSRQRDGFKKLGTAVLWAFTAHEDGCMCEDDLIHLFHLLAQFVFHGNTSKGSLGVNNPSPPRNDVNSLELLV